jgi:pimeloyl-ACP methyl ester carboxylesterase
MPLLLLHGALSSQKQFAPLLPLLGEKFDVHTLNFPGHGGAEMPQGAFSIPLFADAVLHYMDQKGLSSVNIFGYSMGGYVALYLAAHCPERVNKVFTLATKLDWTPEAAQRETAMLDPGKILEKVPAFAKALEEMHAPHDWKVVLQKTAGLLTGLGSNPALGEKELRQIEIPVLISLGELDKMVTLQESMMAAQQLRNGSFSLLAAAPHPFEKVDHSLLAEKMKDFFQ